MDEQPIFPEPPSNPRELDFWFTPEVAVYAGKMGRPGISRTKNKLGGFGHVSEPGWNASVQIERLEKVWIPPQDLQKGLGQWRQEITFKSSFTLEGTPTITTTTLSLWVS